MNGLKHLSTRSGIACPISLMLSEELAASIPVNAQVCVPSQSSGGPGCHRNISETETATLASSTSTTKSMNRNVVSDGNKKGFSRPTAMSRRGVDMPSLPRPRLELLQPADDAIGEKLDLGPRHFPAPECLDDTHPHRIELLRRQRRRRLLARAVEQRL